MLNTYTVSEKIVSECVYLVRSKCSELYRSCCVREGTRLDVVGEVAVGGTAGQTTAGTGGVGGVVGAGIVAAGAGRALGGVVVGGSGAAGAGGAGHALRAGRVGAGGYGGGVGAGPTGSGRGGLLLVGGVGVGVLLLCASGSVRGVSYDVVSRRLKQPRWS